MKELSLHGSFHDMGLQFGKACKKELKTFAKMSYLMASLTKKPGSQPFNPNKWYIIPTFFTHGKEKQKWQSLARAYEKEIEKYHPDAIDYMKGIADGSDLPYIDILTLNISTENMITCSVWGATGSSTSNNEPFIGMNADEEPSAQKFERVLHVNPDKGFSYKVTAFTGWVGYNHGMNEKGLTFAGSLLWTKPAPKKQIGPPMLVLMKVLNTCSTVEEVKEYFESVPNHELGTDFYIADTRKFMRVECTYENRVYKIVENGYLGNTNLLTSPELQHLNGALEMKQTLNAETRSKRMAAMFDQYNGEIDAEVMHKMASDHGVTGDISEGKSICQHQRGLRYPFKTLVSFIAQPKEKRFWIYEGNPCENKVKPYKFEPGDDIH